MTADPFAPEPLPGLRLDGVTVSEAIRMQGEARVHSDQAYGDYDEDFDDDGLRLDVEDSHDERWRWPTPSRTAIITLWIVGLIAAVAIASYAQVLRQRNAAVAMDVSPPPPEAAPAAPQTPIAPEPVLSKSAPIADSAAASTDGASTVAPEAATAAAAAAPDTAAPPPATAKAVRPEPPKTEASKALSAKAESTKAEAANSESKAVAAKGEPAKLKDETNPEAKPDAKPKLPDDIDVLRHRLDHSYAQAVKAGVPRSVMKQREADWAVLYAKAKKKGPQAVAQLYKTRTAQLDALAKKHHPTPPHSTSR